MKVLSVLLALALCAPSRGQRPTVTLSDGSLEGITMETWQGNPVNAFLNVPFAAPPLGPLRFAPPQPVRPWERTRDAGRPAPACTQFAGPEIGVLGQEDCLYLNVYTPQAAVAEGNASLPVIIFFYPGAFNLGTSSAFGPRYLLDYDLILVIPNYRLGILGFLATGDSEAPGNMGLKDQVAALQWIKANIESFGGNPEDVTITGGSAGGQSVTFHYLSPLSKGLFKRGISISGSCLQPSAQQKAPLYKARTVAEALNCPTNTSAALVSCLRSVPDRRLVAQEGMFLNFYYLPFAVFGPTIEPDLPGAFLTQSPYQRLRTGELTTQAPILLSSATHEGLVPAFFFLVNETGLSYANNNWLQVAPSILDYVYTVTSENRNVVSNSVREFYFGNQPITLATNQSLIQMIGDRTWIDDMEVNVRIQASVQPYPVYYYRFGYRGQYSVFNIFTGSNLNFGVSHTDDALYILNGSYPRPENTPSDRAMIGVMTGIWANFAINGTISAGTDVDWLPVNASDAMDGPYNYLKISSPTSLVPETAVTFGNPQFWNNLPINEPGSGRPAFSKE